MSDNGTKEGGEKRRSTRFRPEDEARIKALRVVYEAKARVDISDNDVLRLALADACKANRCEPVPAGGAS